MVLGIVSRTRRIRLLLVVARVGDVISIENEGRRQPVSGQIVAVLQVEQEQRETENATKEIDQRSVGDAETPKARLTQ